MLYENSSLDTLVSVIRSLDTNHIKISDVGSRSSRKNIINQPTITAKGGFGDIVEGELILDKINDFEEENLPIYVKRIKPPNKVKSGASLTEIAIMRTVFSSHKLRNTNLMPALACEITKGSEMHIAIPKGISDASFIVRKSKICLSDNVLKKWCFDAIKTITILHNSLNIIHGDVKPGNFIVFPNNIQIGEIDFFCQKILQSIKNNTLSSLELENTSLILTDFGLSVFSDENNFSIDTEKIIPYTQVYRPPEFWSRANIPKIHKSADIWALGCSLYEFATGEILFSSIYNKDCDVALNLQKTILQNYTKKIPDWLQPIISSCLKQVPNERATINNILQQFYFFNTPIYCVTTITKPNILLENKEIEELCKNDKIVENLAKWIFSQHIKIKENSKSKRIKNMNLKQYNMIVCSIAAKVVKRCGSFRQEDFMCYGQDERIICSELNFKLFPFE